MADISWSREMSVGVDLLDSDHRVLMNIINSLAAIARGPRTPRNAERIGNTLDTLVTYTKSHFGREEKVMVASGFPGLDAHHGEHENFIRDVGEMSKRISRGEEGAVGELAAYLKSWWEHHILIQDMAYRPFAENSEAAQAAAWAFPPLFVSVA